MTAFTDQQRLAHLRLARTSSIGPVSFQQMLEDFGDAEKALDALLSGARAKKVCTREAAERELENALNAGMSLLCLGEERYPFRLSVTPGAPPLIYALGNIRLLEQPLCAIVGARNASGAGIKTATAIATDLCEKGVGIVSGMARGVDTAAHRAALEVGTIACLAGGLDVVYPRENHALYEKIAESGLLVSEMPPGTQPQARHFPRRNRIISGLSDGVVIVEAAARSGSLITARYAAEQGRDLFAVPGSPLDPRSAGANQLIKDGAVLTRNADDVFAELRPAAQTKAPRVKAPSPMPTASDASKKSPPKHPGNLMSLLSPSPIHIDEIVELSGRQAEAVASELQLLELDGKVVRHIGARYSRIE